MLLSGREYCFCCCDFATSREDPSCTNVGSKGTAEFVVLGILGFDESLVVWDGD